MDNDQFDGIAKVLARRISRRGATAVLPGLAALALAGPDAATARHKKKRKRCRYAQQTCGGRNARCCGGLGCGDNGCAGGTVCYQNEGGSCGEDCDCRGDLLCSERKGDTCQYCSYPETECLFTNECCLKDSICGLNGCNHNHAVCCQWEIGSFCYDDCDCCEELGCFGNMCLPLLQGESGAGRTSGKSESEPQAKKGSWARRPE